MKKANYSKSSVHAGAGKIPLAVKFRRNFIYIWWLIAPASVNRLVWKAFFVPRRVAANAEEHQFLSQATSFSVKVRNMDIQCWKWGEGPALIFAHGWNGIGIQFKPMIQHFLNNGYAAITFDAPGHGVSGGMASNYFLFSETMRTLLANARQWNIAGLVGHSLGGSAILNALAKSKLTIPAVTIAAPLNLKKLLFAAFDRHGIPRPVYYPLLEKVERSLGYNIDQDNPAHLLQSIGSQILIVHDPSDRAVPYAESMSYSSGIPNIRLFTPNGLGHKKIVNDPVVVHRVAAFIEEYNTAKNI